MLERASPFADHLAAGASGGVSPAAVTLSELRPAAFIEVLGIPGADVEARARALEALAPGAAALRVGETVALDHRTVGCLAPRRLVVIGARPSADVLAGLDGLLAVVDDSHARAGVRVTGCTTDVLGKGIALDLGAHAFPVGRITQVRGFGVGLTLIRRAADIFDMHCATSLAVSLTEALTDAALEYGWQAGPVIR